MVDGSAAKPALIQDTGYMVEKTYLDITPYLGAFGVYLMLSNSDMVQKCFHIQKTIVGMWRSTHVIFHLVKKPLVLVKNNPNRLYG